MDETDDGPMEDKDNPVGLGKHQIHPLQALLYTIVQNLLDPELIELRQLVKSKIPKTNYEDLQIGQSSPKELFEILLDHKGEEATVKILKNVFKVTGRYFTSPGDDYGESISSMFERYERELEKNKTKFEIRRSCSHFVGRDLYIERICCALCSKDKKAVSICGMGGMGKTTLAAEVCHILKMQHCFAECRIDLRGITDMSRMLIKLLDELGQSQHLTFDGSQIKDITLDVLNKLESETILFLDNVDELLANGHLENFVNEIGSILSNLNNDKVKLLLTMRNKLPVINSEHSEPQRSEMVTSHFCGVLEEFELEKLSMNQSFKVLQKYASEDSEKMSDQELDKLARKCCGNPMLLTLVGGQLRFGYMPKNTTGEKVCPNISMWNYPEMEDILESMLNINKRYQSVLLKLSVFLSFFSRNAAMSVLNSSKEDTNTYLLYLQSRHVVCVDDSGAFRENEANIDSGKKEIYSIHPLIIEYITCGVELDDRRKQCIEVAERNLKKYFNDYLNKLADQSETKCSKVTRIINHQFTHIWHTLQDVESLDLPDLSVKKNFLTALRRNKLLQTVFRNDEEKLKYFELISHKALNLESLWFIFMELSIADQYMTMDTHKGHLKARDIFKNVQFKGIIDRLQSLSGTLDGCQLLLGYYCYVQGRLYAAEAKSDKAYAAAEQSRKVFITHAREDLQLAKIYNLIGVISLDKGNIDEAMEYNTKAYDLVHATDTNHLHYDMVEYAYCIGTCHYDKGYEIYKETKSVENEQYDKAFEWFDKTLEILSRLNLKCSSRSCQVLNNLVSLCLDTESLAKGLNHAMEAKTIAMKYMSSSPIDQVRAVINVGHLWRKFAQKQGHSDRIQYHYENAEKEFNEVLVICCREKLTAEDIGKGDNSVYYTNFSKGIINSLKCLKKFERLQKVMADLEKLENGIPLSTGMSDGSSSPASNNSSDSENQQHGAGRITIRCVTDSSDSSEMDNQDNEYNIQTGSPIKRQSSPTADELETDYKKLCLESQEEMDQAHVEHNESDM